MRSHLQINVAHELRTPLAAIRGYTRMILDGRGGAVNDTHREYLRVVTENTNRLINLIGWMSYVGELSGQHFKLSSFDLREAWNAAARAAQSKLADKSLVLSQRIPDEAFALIGDREKLEYILNEVLGLAIRLADVGSTMTAELSHGREGEIHFKLAQKGAAIPADTLSTIFDRPYNAFTKLTAQNMESGAINLSGVYDVVGMHGGRVFVNNTAGQGVTFLFTLPSVMAGEEKNNEQTVNSGRRRR
jgi:signal transduction histidine kinase